MSSYTGWRIRSNYIKPDGTVSPFYKAILSSSRWSSRGSVPFILRPVGTTHRYKKPYASRRYGDNFLPSLKPCSSHYTWLRQSEWFLHFASS